MAVLTDALSEGLLRLIFLNEPFMGIGDAAGLVGSALAGSLFLSLHTADPGHGGTQTTSEVTYPGYTRPSVVRNAAGTQPRWMWNGAEIINDGRVNFAACGVGGVTVTHVGVGSAASGPGVLLYRIALAAPRLIASGSTPYVEDAAFNIVFVTT